MKSRIGRKAVKKEKNLEKRKRREINGWKIRNKENTERKRRKKNSEEIQ